MSYTMKELFIHFLKQYLQKETKQILQCFKKQ